MKKNSFAVSVCHRTGFRNCTGGWSMYEW